MHYDFVSMRIFVNVVQLGSLTQAAKQLHLATSAVSKRITEIENKIGIDLLYRYPRGVSPTPAGLTFFRRSQHILRELNNLDAALSTYVSGAKGSIRLAANTASTTQYLTADLVKFKGEYPDVELFFIEENSDRVVDNLLNGHIDIGILSKEYATPALDIVDYHHDTLYVCMNAAHPLAGQGDIALDALIEYSIIKCAGYFEVYRKVNEAAKAADRVLNFAIEVSSVDSLVEMLLANMGMAVLPETCARRFEVQHGLVRRPLSDEWAVCDLVVAKAKHAELTVPIQNMLKHLARTAI